LVRELKSVGEKICQSLAQSFFVAIKVGQEFQVLWMIDQGFQLNIFQSRLVRNSVEGFVNGFNHVKVLIEDSERIVLHLSVVHQIIYQIFHVFLRKNLQAQHFFNIFGFITKSFIQIIIKN
jgi:hypothetical protein